jgi:hypothetical protein
MLHPPAAEAAPTPSPAPSQIGRRAAAAAPPSPIGGDGAEAMDEEPAAHLPPLDPVLLEIYRAVFAPSPNGSEPRRPHRP